MHYPHDNLFMAIYCFPLALMLNVPQQLVCNHLFFALSFWVHQFFSLVFQKNTSCKSKMLLVIGQRLPVDPHWYSQTVSVKIEQAEKCNSLKRLRSDAYRQVMLKSFHGVIFFWINETEMLYNSCVNDVVFSITSDQLGRTILMVSDSLFRCWSLKLNIKPEMLSKHRK